MVAALTAAAGPQGCDAQVDAERIDLIRALEDLKNAAAGLQVCVTEALDASQRAQQLDAGESARRVGQGVAAQVALARRTSPHRGRRFLSLVRILRAELPCTYRALRAGKITEQAATLMAHGTACVSREDRLTVDAEIAGDPDEIERLGERGVQVAAAKAAYRLDPASVVERRRRAEADRYVSLRPAPDTMTYLTALLPVADGVAVYAALSKTADTARAGGSPQTRGQVMTDTLRDAVLGHEPAAAATNSPTASRRTASRRTASRRTASRRAASRRAAGIAPDREAQPGTEPEPQAQPGAGTDRGLVGAPAGVGVVLNIVMTEEQLFGRGEGSEGEALIGGPAGGVTTVDADLVRQIAALTATDRIWLRRLYTRPESGELVAADSKQRRFPPGLQRLIRFRDQHCRTPWCHAPIRHTDHATRSADDGATVLVNGQGLCEACNQAKEAPGWWVRASTDGDTHRVTTTTPTGHTYVTTPPRPPGSAPRPTAAVRTLWTTRRAATLEIVAPPSAA